LKYEHHYSGWLLPNSERKRLLEIIHPKFDTIIAHHITYEFGITKKSILPSEMKGIIVGEASNDVIQALVVEISGTINRPVGGFYHITWSLEKGFAKPFDSNKLLSQGFDFINPIEIEIFPHMF